MFKILFIIEQLQQQHSNIFIKFTLKLFLYLFKINWILFSVFSLGFISQSFAFGTNKNYLNVVHIFAVNTNTGFWQSVRQ